MSKFQDTEIGTIPADWFYPRFSDVLSEGTRNGIYKSKEHHGQGVKIINMGELFAFDRIGNQVMQRLNLTENEKERFLVQDGDLLFARRSLVAEGAGKCSLVVKPSEETTFESSIIRARPNRDIVDPKYLAYLFSSRVGRYLMDTILRQVAVSGITGTDLVGLKIPLPKKEEQTEVATLLSSLDEKIELNRMQNHTLEGIAQALFKRWFVEFEFPDENGQPYQSSGGAMQPTELGEIPVGWEVKPLDQIAEYLNGLAMQKFRPEGDEYLPVIKIRELKQGVTANSDKASTKLDPKYIIDDGDVLFSWSGSLEVDIWCHGKGALNQHLFKVSSDTYPKWFYYLWTKHHLRAFQAVAADKATTMGHIQRTHLTEALTVCPSMDELQGISEVFEPLIEKVIANRIESRGLTKIRDMLLPKLISGELRVA